MSEIDDLLSARFDEMTPLVHALPWDDKRAYACWLAQTHAFVLRSTRLLALAGARVDTASEALHLRFLEHDLNPAGIDALREESNEIDRKVATVTQQLQDAIAAADDYTAAVAAAPEADAASDD